MGASDGSMTRWPARQPLPEPPSRDEEAAALRAAWLDVASRCPERIGSLIDDDRFLDAAIELGRAVIGEPALLGWRLTFTSAGGPYEARLFWRRGGTSGESIGDSDRASSLAFLLAIQQFRETVRD